MLSATSTTGIPLPLPTLPFPSLIITKINFTKKVRFTFKGMTQNNEGMTKLRYRQAKLRLLNGQMALHSIRNGLYKPTKYVYKIV